MTELPAVMNQAFQDGYRKAYARELFTAFRNTFAAQYLPHRVIFWVEEKSGQAIVRQVKNLQRKRKCEDAIVGITVNEIPAIRVLIGNFSSGCKLTIAQWEIYRDFNLLECIARGRFDYQDLTGDVSVGERKVLIRWGIYPKGDWDFDGILLTHQCPLCGGVFDRTSVLYVSHRPCESCGAKIPLNRSHGIIKKLISQQRWKRERIIEHWVPSPNGEVRVQDFIDPAANSVAFWPIEQLGCNLNVQGVFNWFSGCFDDFKELYNRSLFRLIVKPELEKCLTTFVRRVSNGHGSALIKSIVRVSERFSSLWWEERKTNQCSLEEIRQTDSDISTAVMVLPVLINELILNHRKLNTERQKIK